MPTVVNAYSTTPYITVQPTSVTVQAGFNTSMHVVASVIGGGTLSYAWERYTGPGNTVGSKEYTYFNDGDGITGTQTNTLVFSKAVSLMSGTYICKVTNSSGSYILSSEATITVNGTSGGTPTPSPTTNPANPYNPTSLGKGDGANFYCKRLPFGYAQDQRVLPPDALSKGDDVYAPGTVVSYDYSWELNLTCGNLNKSLRAPGTNSMRRDFVVPITLPLSQQTRPAPFLTPAVMQKFCNNCTQTFQDESCLDHVGIWHPLDTSRPQGRWLFCDASSDETPSNQQITFPPPSGLGRNHYQGECSYQPNVDAAS